MKTPLILTDGQIARFWSKVDIKGPDACWLWLGWTTPQGYGRFDFGPSKALATHVALTLSGFPRPPAPGDYALHGDTCESSGCCNPHHLRWGSARENAEDRDRLGRRVRVPRGNLQRSAKLDPDKVRYIRSSPRSQYELAAELGVSQVLVGKVRNRKVWRHVA